MKLDQIDHKILDVLKEHKKKNPRDGGESGMRLVELSRLAGLSYTTARYRALSLEKQGHVIVVQGRNKFVVFGKQSRAAEQ